MKKLLLLAFFIPMMAMAQGSVFTNSNSCYNFSRNLYFGFRGADVQNLQEFLRSKGFFTGNASGYFGFVTKNAVAQWQNSNGINSVGMFGMMSRKKFNDMCGNNNYVNPETIPVYNFVPSVSCQSWFDGCNECARNNPGDPAACTQRACFAAGKGYCKTFFKNNTNQSPTISQFSGPTVLTINQTGTWTITASDPLNRQLTYNILWGDEQNIYAPNNNSASLNPVNQTTTFTHSYANPGNYTVAITVVNSNGQTVKSTATVQVGQGNIVCTTEYAPVCGQPPEPACRYSVPACMIATPGPKTYSNRCELNAAGASFLYSGSCTNGN